MFSSLKISAICSAQSEMFYIKKSLSSELVDV